MPFDAAEPPDCELRLYRDRRETACQLWESLSQWQFDLRTWQSSCGTTACAAGWLAATKHDGWFFWQGVPVREETIEAVRDPFSALAEYFGLSRTTAASLFGGEGDYTVYRGVTSLPVRPEHVAAALREAPYRTRADRVVEERRKTRQLVA